MGEQTTPQTPLFTLASNALTTLEHLKLYLSIPQDDTSYDDFLTMLINYASGWIESQIGRKLGINLYTEQVKGSGYQELVLRNYPLRKIKAIWQQSKKYPINHKGYSIHETGEIGVVYKDTGWTRQAYNIGLVPDPLISKRYLNTEYIAGYVLPKDQDGKPPEEWGFPEDWIYPEDWGLPMDLQGVIWQLAGQELALNESGADGLSAFSISDVSWTFDKEPRQSWLDIIGIYKRVV